MKQLTHSDVDGVSAINWTGRDVALFRGATSYLNVIFLPEDSTSGEMAKKKPARERCNHHQLKC